MKFAALIILLALSLPQTSFSQGNVFLKLNVSTSRRISITAFTDADSITYSAPLKKTLRQSKALIEIASLTEIGNRKTIQTTSRLVESLSSSLIRPMRHLINSASRLAVHDNDLSIRIPFEFLKADTTFLFQMMPIVYSSSNLKEFETLPLAKGFIVRDSTTDPESACETISKLYPSSKFIRMEETTVDSLRKEQTSDFLLWSVHGGYHSPTSQSILTINDQFMPPQWISCANLKLAYFDSCDLGKGINFINYFRETGTQYFLGPIISNESGNSSTKTILAFFNHLKEVDPVTALYRTKLSLLQYTGKDTVKELWYAAAFRIYRLN